MKECARCNEQKPAAEFCRSAASSDGRQSWCKDCARDYMRGRKRDPARVRARNKASVLRHPERRRARERVKDAIRRGDLAPAKSLKCTDCGDPASAYDHADHSKPLDVEPVCSVCHGRRSRSRGEHARHA